MADPRIRVSDAEREETVDRLSRHVASGRISLDEFSERAAHAYRARTVGELAALTRDLPRPSPPEPAPRRPNITLIVALAVIVTLVVLGALAAVFLGSMMCDMGPMHS